MELLFVFLVVGLVVTMLKDNALGKIEEVSQQGKIEEVE